MRWSLQKYIITRTPKFNKLPHNEINISQLTTSPNDLLSRYHVLHQTLTPKVLHTRKITKARDALFGTDKRIPTDNKTLTLGLSNLGSYDAQDCLQQGQNAEPESNSRAIASLPPAHSSFSPLDRSPLSQHPTPGYSLTLLNTKLQKWEHNRFPSSLISQNQHHSYNVQRNFHNLKTPAPSDNSVQNTAEITLLQKQNKNNKDKKQTDKHTNTHTNRLTDKHINKQTKMPYPPQIVKRRKRHQAKAENTEQSS